VIFHCLSVPYTATRKEYSLCAFTQKVYKFCDEMTKRGHTVYHYGHKDSVVNCTEHITVTDDDILRETYGDLNSWRTNGYDQHVDNKACNIFNSNCHKEINKRLKSKNEFILCWFGFGNLKCAENFYEKAIVIEPSIGYDSMFAPVRIFETRSQQHKLHGNYSSIVDFGREFINYPGFNKNDFEYKSEKSNIALFLGRIINEKGARLTYDICNHIKQEIIFAGPNILKLPDTKYCKFIGFVDPEKRKELLSNAKFLIAPSLFIEPCNWTVIEAQFSGTPTVTTDFGGFTETVIQNKTGYRCFSPKNLVNAILNIQNISPNDCYLNAINRYTIQKQCDNYEMIFKSLLQ
jgi:glycosyltransferase involved in cell wall biosynthesis